MLAKKLVTKAKYTSGRYHVQYIIISIHFIHKSHDQTVIRNYKKYYVINTLNIKHGLKCDIKYTVLKNEIRKVNEEYCTALTQYHGYITNNRCPSQFSGHTWSCAWRSTRSRPPLLRGTPLHCSRSATHAARRSWAEKDFCWLNWHAACSDVSLQAFFLFGFPPRSFKNVLVQYI